MTLLFALLIFVIGTVNSVCNKTKRTLSEDILGYGEAKPILVYTRTPIASIFSNIDNGNLNSGYKNSAPLNSYLPINLHPYPQFPEVATNRYRTQFPILNRDNQNGQYKNQALATTVTGQYVMPSDPVLPFQQKQHNIFLQQHIPNDNIKHLTPFGKYYNNGKDQNNYGLYNSVHSYNPQNQNQFPPQQEVATGPFIPNYHDLHYQRLHTAPNANYDNGINHNSRRLNLNGVKYISPNLQTDITLNRKSIQPKVNSLKRPIKKIKNMEIKKEDEDFSLKGIENKRENDKISSEREDDSDHDFEKHQHRYDFEENDDHINEKNESDDTEEEYDQDTKRGSTTLVIARKLPNKQSQNNKYGNFYKSLSNNHKQQHPKHKGISKTSKMMYNFSSERNDSNNDSTENNQPENIPVTRSHKQIRQKWYISKNIDGKIRE